MFSAPLLRSAPDSHTARTHRSTNWIMSGLGYSASISAARLTEGQMERRRTRLVSPCTVLWINCRCELNQHTYPEPSIMLLSIAGPWQILRRTSPSGINGMGSLGASTRRKVKRRSWPGGWASKIFFGSLMCVLSLERRLLLTSSFQKVPAKKTVPAVSHGITNTHATVSGFQNTLPIVSDSHRSGLKRPEDTRGRDQVVNTIHILYVAE